MSPCLVWNQRKTYIYKLRPLTYRYEKIRKKNVFTISMGSSILTLENFDECIARANKIFLSFFSRLKLREEGTREGFNLQSNTFYVLHTLVLYLD